MALRFQVVELMDTRRNVAIHALQEFLLHADDPAPSRGEEVQR
jgi:hypothetical protein